MSDQIEIRLTAALYVVVRESRNSLCKDWCDVSLRTDTYPNGSRISFTTVPKEDAHVAADIGVWFGSTLITMPWLDVVKVADFLRLDIPLPHPLGEQVPA